MKIVRPGGALVGFPVVVGVLEDEHLVHRLLTRINMRVGHRSRNPKPSAVVPPHRNRAGQFREILLGRKAVDLETRVNPEGLLFIGWREELVGAT